MLRSMVAMSGTVKTFPEEARFCWKSFNKTSAAASALLLASSTFCSSARDTDATVCNGFAVAKIILSINCQRQKKFLTWRSPLVHTLWQFSMLGSSILDIPKGASCKQHSLSENEDTLFWAARAAQVPQVVNISVCIWSLRKVAGPATARQAWTWNFSSLGLNL